jgi:hypothetical protein
MTVPAISRPGLARQQPASPPGCRVARCPPGPYTVGEIAKDLGRSAGVVGNALATLADDLLVKAGCHKGGHGAGLVAVIVAAESSLRWPVPACSSSLAVLTVEAGTRPSVSALISEDFSAVGITFEHAWPSLLWPPARGTP